MTIDLVFKVPHSLRNLNGIEKGARHFKFDFEISRIFVCFDSPVVVALSAAPEEKLT